MANQTGRPIAPARKLVAAVMGTIAVFVMALGLGMSSWGVVIFGLALLALSAALGMVNMVRRGARAWVAGTAEVKAISPPPGSTTVYGRAQIQAVVVAPGLPTSEVTIHEPRVPVVKWPEPGDTLPIMVDVDDMRRVRINWDDASPRERGEDPPPPPAAVYGDDPDGADPHDELDSDLLGDIEPPPWTNRDTEWGRGPDEPPPPPAAGYDDDETADHGGAAGPILEGSILEGEFVDHDDELPPLPRRAAPASPPEHTPAPPGPVPTAVTHDDAPGGGATEAATNAEPPETATSAGPSETATSGGPSETATSAGPSETAVGVPNGAPANASADATTRMSTGAAPIPEPAAGRPSGGRPSPRPRGGGTATATAEHRTAYAPHRSTPEAPHQRGPHPDDALLTDIPLDDPAPQPETTSTTESVPAPETSSSAGIATDDESVGWAAIPAVPQTEPGPRRTAPAQAEPDRQQPRRPEPTPASAAASPSPVTSFPTAPAATAPAPTAPAPTAPAPTAPAAVPASSSPTPPAADDWDHDDIDLPLDADPDPAPETTAAAAGAVADGLIAPPDDSATSAVPPPATAPHEVHPSTKFVSNAAHEAEVPTEQIAAVRSDPQTPAPDAVAAVPATAGAPAARAGVTAAAVAAVPATAAAAGAGAGAAVAAVPATAAAAASRAGAAAPAESSGEARPDGGPWAQLAGSSEPDDRAGDVLTAYPSARPGPACAIYGVGITVLVSDLARSVAFYRDTLGFYEIDNGDGSAVLATGDTRLVLRADPGLAAGAGRQMSVNLEVGDVEAVYEELRAKGVRFVHDPRAVNRGDRLELWSASFRDPDDHDIAITQWRAIR